MAGCVRACVRGEMSAHGILRYLAAAAGGGGAGGGADARITNMALTLRRSRHIASPRRLSSPPSTDI